MNANAWAARLRGVGLALLLGGTVVAALGRPCPLTAAPSDAVISIGQTGWSNSWMYRIDRDGNVLWQKPLPFAELPIWHWPADRNLKEDALYLPIFGDGNRVGGNNRVQKYDAAGDLVFDVALFPKLVNVSANPALGGCYVADEDLGVYRLDGAGNVVWGPTRFGVDHPPLGNANWTVVADPTTGGGFAGHVDHWEMGELVHFDRNGTVVWMTSHYYITLLKANPVDGGVYVAHDPYGSTTTRLDADGQVEWSVPCFPSCYPYPRTVSPLDGALTVSSGWPAYLAHLRMDGTVAWMLGNDNGAGYAFANLSLSADATSDAFYGGAASNTPGVGKYRGSDGSELWFVNPGNGADQFHVWMGLPSGIAHSPTITHVADVPNDQGGKVRVMWSASDLDVLPNRGIASYTVWRRYPTDDALAAIDAGATLLGAGAAPAATGVRSFRHTTQGAASTYWEFVASIPALGVDHYSCFAMTGSDLMPDLVPYEVFLVDAREIGSSAVHMSLPDSGYSVDNLAPAAPASLTGAYLAGTTWLHWAPCGEADFKEYAIERGTSAGGPWTRLATQPDTGYADLGPAGRYYRVAGCDVHGNAGAFALLTPQGTVDVGGDPGLRFGLGPVRPNPAGGDRLAVEFVLARDGAARLELLDIAGRRVRSRDVGGLGTGRHQVDLVFAQRLPAGLYLLCLTQGEQRSVARVAIVD